MKLLTAVSMAVLALSIAFDSKAYYFESNESSRGRYIAIRDADIYGTGKLYKAYFNSSSIFEPYAGWLGSIAKANYRWESESFKHDQIAGAEFIKGIEARSRPHCELMVQCFGDHLLSIEYHQATIEGVFKEWYTATVIKIIIPGYATYADQQVKLEIDHKVIDRHNFMIWIPE